MRLTIILIACGVLLAAVQVNAGTPVATSIHNEREPAVAYVSNGEWPKDTPGVYLVVWEKENDIYGQLFTDQGVKIGGHITIAATSWDESRPAIASNQEDTFLVVYQRSNASGSFDIYGQGISDKGLPTGSSFKISSSTKSATAPTVTYDTWQDYVVVWEHHHSSTDRDIRARLIRWDGTLGREFPVAESIKDESEPDVAGKDCWTNGPRLMVAWEHAYSSTDTDIKCRSFELIYSDGAPDLNLYPIRTVAELISDESSPAIGGGCSSDHEFYVAWTDRVSPGPKVKGRRVWVGYAGDPPMSTVEVLNGRNAITPDVVNRLDYKNGYEWTVVFNEQLDIWEREVGSAGSANPYYKVSGHYKPEWRPAVAPWAPMPTLFVVYELDYSSTDKDIYATIHQIKP